jgi:2-keto-4-pentenoate hydratase/2-oxohepta-3-ene-1,7-dioic acid hydratase in catechol pathway
MIVLAFHHDDGLRLGIKRGDEVLDVTAVAGEKPPSAAVARGATGASSVTASAVGAGSSGGELPRSPLELYEQGLPALARLEELESNWHALAEYVRPESELRLGPPVPRPGKILCVGLNYRKHAAESGVPEPQAPVLFSKFGNSIAGPHDEVGVVGLEQVDYEAELALVIGRRGKDIPEEEALSYVLGYLNANDLSERQLQFVSGQWLVGKTLDRFMPIGPYLVTADEAGDPQEMTVRCWLNGELRQDSNTADMIFSVAQIISYASRYMTLEPGDIISTGTPEGVVLGMDEKVWVQPGDEVVVEVGKLGRLTNRIVVRH